MLTGALGSLAALLTLPLVVVVPQALDDGGSCPPGTRPASVGSGVICVVATDPGAPGDPGDQGDAADDGHGELPVGCHKSDGTEVPCQTSDGTWWSGHQCYAEPYDAPAGSAAWQGHSNGSLWGCTSCESAGASTTCDVQVIWTAPGQEPGPPTPEELASTALGQLPLAKAKVRTAPAPPDATYIGIENWLWIPESQWATLHKSVTAESTTVTVTAAPAEVSWNVGPRTITCHGPGRAWVKGMTDAASTTCSVTYRDTSVDELGGRFAITATIRYRVTWACSGACPTAGGALGLVDAPAGAGSIRVLQRQTVVVQ